MTSTTVARSTSVKAAFHFLCQRMPSDYELTQSEYVNMLMDLLYCKGGEAIEALAGFYLFAIRNISQAEGANGEPSKCTKSIYQTFTHDLNGRKNKFELPRSSDYLDVWRIEHQKYSN